MHAWMISEAPCERSVVLCGFWIRPSLRLHIICKDGEDPMPRLIMVGRFWDSINSGCICVTLVMSITMYSNTVDRYQLPGERRGV